MTAPLRSTPHPSAIPASQNTAPVAEFRCLFTHDIRRKQKRWQDGYLKFHTFNNRVMVYDESRNFLGDTYYKDSNELHEGDEINLDKGVMVEVAEAMGTTQTDLTPLFEKRTKEPPARPNAPSQTRPFQRPTSVAPNAAPQTGSQLRHKSLNTLLGTPKGPIGKAVPMKSPYEARKQKENESVEERPPKRQRAAQKSTSWRASSPVHDESPVSKKDPPACARNVRKPAKFIPPGANVIVLDSESDPTPAILSDVTLPSTPPGFLKSRAKPPPPPQPIIKPIVLERPPIQTPKIPRGKVPVPNVKAAETPTQSAPTSSPPVSASNRLTNVDFAVQPARKRLKEPTPQASPLRNPKTKSLRLSTGVKRGTLLCQSLPQQAPRASSESRTSVTAAKARKTSQPTTRELSLALSHDNESHSQASSTVTKTTPPIKGKRKGSKSNEVIVSKRAKLSASPSEVLLDVFDDPEVIHGIMDQQLLVLSSPVQPQEVLSSPAFDDPEPKPAMATRTAGRKKTVHEPSSPRAPDLRATKPRLPSPKSTTRKAPPRKKAAEKPEPIRKPSLPPAPVLEPPVPLSREVSPAHTEASDDRSRNSSTSPSKVALSTGGFRKKPKRSPGQSATTVPTPEIPTPIPRNETVPLPPHPLRAGRKAPVMSTSELASLLQKPKKTKKPIHDPIEDDTPAPGKSPTRNFRRVRSENDAPIPSTAEDWEKRNLPRKSSNLTDIADDSGITMPAADTALPLKKKNTTGLSALIKKTDPRRRFQRTQSLSVQTNVPPAVEAEVDIPSPIVDEDVGPWSTEAFDLFDWRPPNRE